jgi:hypothetical protein
MVIVFFLVLSYVVIMLHLAPWLALVITAGVFLLAGLWVTRR